MKKIPGKSEKLLKLIASIKDVGSDCCEDMTSIGPDQAPRMAPRQAKHFNNITVRKSIDLHSCTRCL